MAARSDHAHLVALARLEQGNLSNAKGVGEGVLEYRIDWGPGYRVYFGRDGELLVDGSETHVWAAAHPNPAGRMKSVPLPREVISKLSASKRKKRKA